MGPAVRRARRDGRTRALLWYIRQVARSPFHVGLERLSAVPKRVASALLGVVSDLRYGARILARRPGYTAASVLTLGLGVGGVAAVYGAAKWVLLRPVPGVVDSDRLVTVQLELRGEGGFPFPLSDLDLRDLAASIPALDRLAASRAHDVHVEVGHDGTPRRVTAAVVTSDYFDVLGLSPALGPVLANEPGTVMLSHRVWREMRRGSLSVLGSTIRMNGRPYTVVGVAPPGFRGAELPGGTDLWLPAPAFPEVSPEYPEGVLGLRGTSVWRNMVGELAPGALPEQVQPQSDVAIASIREAWGREHSFAADLVLRAYPGPGLSPRIRDAVERTLTLLAATAAALLLLALANVTNLALAHAAARRGVLMVHAASRMRLVRLVLSEHLIMGTLGAAGAGVSALGIAWLFRNVSLSPFGASLGGLQADGRVAAFTLAASLVAGVVAGLVPALAPLRADHLGCLQGRSQGRRHTFRLQSGLVVEQVALSTLLLVGAGLLVRSVLNLRSTDMGFEPEHALRFSIDPRNPGLRRRPPLGASGQRAGALGGRGRRGGRRLRGALAGDGLLAHRVPPPLGRFQ